MNANYWKSGINSFLKMNIQENNFFSTLLNNENEYDINEESFFHKALNFINEAAWGLGISTLFVLYPLSILVLDDRFILSKSAIWFWHFFLLAISKIIFFVGYSFECAHLQYSDTIFFDNPITIKDFFEISKIFPRNSLFSKNDPNNSK